MSVTAVSSAMLRREKLRTRGRPVAGSAELRWNLHHRVRQIRKTAHISVRHDAEAAPSESDKRKIVKPEVVVREIAVIGVDTRSVSRDERCLVYERRERMAPVGWLNGERPVAQHDDRVPGTAQSRRNRCHKS